MPAGAPNLTRAQKTLAGNTFYIRKALTSSDITTTGIAVTGASTGGRLLLRDVVVQCDSTGLAGGTNLTLNADNAKGSAVFFSSAISGLGANAIIDLDSASVTSKSFVLESGKTITAKQTTTSGTGAGTCDVYLVFERLDDSATVAAS